MKPSILCIFFSIFISSLLAQKPNSSLMARNKIIYDTLFIYDTIFVTDTIRLKRCNAIEQLPPSNIFETNNGTTQKNLIINKYFAATISVNHILLSDSNQYFLTIKKFDKMKRLNFFGVVLFAFQNMVVAQNNVSLSLGGGAYNLKTSENFVRDQSRARGNSTTELTGLFKIGINGERNFFKSKISIGSSLNYHFLKGADFPAYDYTGNPTVVSEGYRKNYHMISIPLFVRWNAKSVKPFSGAEFYDKITPKIAEEATSSTSKVEYYQYVYIGASALFGFDVDLSKRIQARFVYAQGLTTEHSLQSSGNTYSTKMKRFEISLMYNLKARDNNLKVR